MNILVIEASGARAAVAALEVSKFDLTNENELIDAKVRAVWSSDDVRSLSRELVLRIAETLNSARWTLNDVGALAVGLGPGSWTSLRVVLATCKTLAQALDWKIVGVPSFDGIARAAYDSLQSQASHETSSTRNAETLIAVVSASRANEIYSKIFRVQNENWSVEQEERVQSDEELRHQLQSASGGAGQILVAGEAAHDFCKDNFSRTFAPSFSTPVFVDVENAALHLGVLAARRLSRGQSDDALTLQPLYVSLSAAERNLALKNM